MEQCVTFFEHGNMGPTSKDGNKWPSRPQTKNICLKLHCDRHELLGSSEDKFWVQKMYGEKYFESITDSQLKHRPWRCSSWIRNSIIHPYRLSDVFMSWMSLQYRIAAMDSSDKHVEQISFGTASHFANMGSWKAGSPASNPQRLEVAKSWISTILYCFVAFVSIPWKRKHGKQMALETTNQKHLFETSLWQAWVAWIERGQILGTENVQRKIIRIHHWRCSSWIVTRNSIIHP